MKQSSAMKTISLPKISFIGGDMRLVYAYEYLQNQRYPAAAYGLANGTSSHNLAHVLKKASVFVCGIPLSNDNQTLSLTSEPFLKTSPVQIDYFLSCLTHVEKSGDQRYLFAGKIPENIRKFCKEQKIKCHDFLEDESFAAANALPTAEGAIMEAISLGNTVLENQECLVLGYGKCGSVLAEKLKALSAHVTIYTRHPEQKHYFKALGYQFHEEPLPFHKTISKTDETLILQAADRQCTPSLLSKYTYIFNTVPALLLDADTLSYLSPDTVIIDIASLPGGIDYETASSFPVRIKHSLGIPGKIAPKYAGELIAQTILSSIY